MELLGFSIFIFVIFIIVSWAFHPNEQEFTLEDIEIYLGAMDTESLEYPRQSDKWWAAYQKLERMKQLLTQGASDHREGSDADEGVRSGPPVQLAPELCPHGYRYMCPHGCQDE